MASPGDLCRGWPHWLLRSRQDKLLALLIFSTSAGIVTTVGVPSSASPLYMALGAGGSQDTQVLKEMRKMRNSRAVLEDQERLYSVVGAVEDAMRAAYEDNNLTTICNTSNGEGEAEGSCADGLEVLPSGNAARRPGNFHGVKRHAYYVGAISEAHPSLPFDSVQSIVASEWYHPGLTAKSVWCVEKCGDEFPLAKKLDANFEAIHREIDTFWRHPDAFAELKGVGSHTTQFDKYIAGNGTWVDVRLWRGRAYNRRLCEKHFRVICGIVEASPEIWTNPWSHVLLSVLLRDSWVPFHQGHTNGQLTYHLPVMLPENGVAELAVVDRGGSVPDGQDARGKVMEHPEEHTVRWRKGSTLVFDDSYTHAVRFRTDSASQDSVNKPALADNVAGYADRGLGEARVLLLLRGWHPELEPEERAAIRDFVRKGGEEEPEGYDMLPIVDSVFHL